MKKIIEDKLTTVIFYASILIFIIAFNFAHNPPSGWYQQFMPDTGGRTIVDITFNDSLTGYIVTSRLSFNDSSLILKTTDGGENWFVIHTDSGFIYKKIQYINENTGFVVGSYMIKTTDAGISWHPINVPVPIEDISALNGDTIFIVFSEGLTGGVYRTTNGGVSWDRQLNLGSQNPDHIYMFNGRIGYISEVNGGAPYIRKTTNSGLNWFILVNGQSFRDMYFMDSLKGWRAYSNNMYLTTNGGIEWETQLLPSGGIIITNGINEFSNISSDIIWGCGGWVQYSNNQTRGIVYRTTNGGSNWLYQIPDTSINIFQYFYSEFINNNTGWVYGRFTGINTISGGDTTFTNIQLIGNGTPTGFKLYQNYPNPFNPQTKIIYRINKKGFVDLKVYDIKGDEVTILVNQNQNPGEYTIVFDGSNLSSGVYFYRFEFTEDNRNIFTDTKKMILLR